MLNAKTLSPLLTKKEECTLTLEDILNNDEAINDLKDNPSSQLQDL